CGSKTAVSKLIIVIFWCKKTFVPSPFLAYIKVDCCYFIYQFWISSTIATLLEASVSRKPNGQHQNYQGHCLGITVSAKTNGPFKHSIGNPGQQDANQYRNNTNFTRWRFRSHNAWE